MPPKINHAVLTGTLTTDPQEARSPAGDPVSLLRIEFPVVDPERPASLWTWASWAVEVPAALAARRDVSELQGGTPILASGQLSDRWMIEDGHTSRRGVIVASLIHPGPSPEKPSDLFVIRGGS